MRSRLGMAAAMRAPKKVVNGTSTQTGAKAALKDRLIREWLRRLAGERGEVKPAAAPAPRRTE
jgi:hypothetical protein